MTQRPPIYEWVPPDRTGYRESDESSYQNNRNLRPITPYWRERELVPVLWCIDPGAVSKRYDGAFNPLLRDYGIRDYLIAKCKAESIELLDMIMLTRDLTEAVKGTTSFMLRVPRTIKLLKQGRFAEAARNQGWKGRKSIPSTYLAYTYAISPLVADCAHLWDFATETKPAVFMTEKTAHKRLAVSYDIDRTGDPTAPMIARFSQNVHHSVRVVRRYSSDAFLDLEGLSINPIPTVWDSIPYSFVVDWFVPIGDALKMISYSGVQPKDGYNCYKVQNKHTVTFPYGPYTHADGQPDRIYQYGTGLPQAESFYFERVVDDTLTWTLPEAAAAFKNSANLSLRRLLNAFMMAWQSCK